MLQHGACFSNWSRGGGRELARSSREGFVFVFVFLFVCFCYREIERNSLVLR